jgi:hypothetical protein
MAEIGHQHWPVTSTRRKRRSTAPASHQQRVRPAGRSSQRLQQRLRQRILHLGSLAVRIAAARAQLIGIAPQRRKKLVRGTPAHNDTAPRVTVKLGIVNPRGTRVNLRSKHQETFHSVRQRPIRSPPLTIADQAVKHLPTTLTGQCTYAQTTRRAGRRSSALARHQHCVTTGSSRAQAANVRAKTASVPSTLRAS